MGLREEWARVIVHAWEDTAFMEKLRRDPKTTLDDEGIRQQLQLEELGTDTSGYLPLPDKPEGLDQLNKEKLETFLRDNTGVFGLMNWCAL